MAAGAPTLCKRKCPAPSGGLFRAIFCAGISKSLWAAYNLIETPRELLISEISGIRGRLYRFCLNKTSAANMARDYSLGSVEVSLTPHERFEEYLRSRKMRYTQERRALVDHVFSQHEHFDANGLLEDLAEKFDRKSRPSRATVYRTLNELVEAGLLRKFPVGSRDVYEHDYGYPQHDHLHCKKCERLIEFQSDELMELRDRVARDHGFRVTGHRLIITGVCAECSAVKRRTRRRHDLI